MRRVKRKASKKKVKAVKKAVVNSEIEPSSEEKKDNVVSLPKGLKKSGFPTHLSDAHLREIERRTNKMTTARLLMSVGEQAFRNMNLEMDLLRMKVDKQKAVVVAKDSEYKECCKGYTAFLKSIFPIYGYSENDKFGFNPDTGEIIKPEDLPSKKK